MNSKSVNDYKLYNRTRYEDIKAATIIGDTIYFAHKDEIRKYNLLTGREDLVHWMDLKDTKSMVEY